MHKACGGSLPSRQYKQHCEPTEKRNANLPKIARRRCLSDAAKAPPPCTQIIGHSAPSLHRPSCCAQHFSLLPIARSLHSFLPHNAPLSFGIPPSTSCRLMRLVSHQAGFHRVLLSEQQLSWGTRQRGEVATSLQEHSYSITTSAAQKVSGAHGVDGGLFMSEQSTRIVVDALNRGSVLKGLPPYVFLSSCDTEEIAAAAHKQQWGRRRLSSLGGQQQSRLPSPTPLSESTTGRSLMCSARSRRASGSTGRHARMPSPRSAHPPSMPYLLMPTARLASPSERLTACAEKEHAAGGVQRHAKVQCLCGPALWWWAISAPCASCFPLLTSSYLQCPNAE